VIQNAVIEDVTTVSELQAVFDEGSKNVASTKMNAESSRSHLVIGIVIETTNVTTGDVLRGKVGTTENKVFCHIHDILVLFVIYSNPVHVYAPEIYTYYNLLFQLSLVDLARSERAAKTGATPEQLKEAQSINKSLSALGDVIQALSSEANFVPYRNNKLTMLMQDSLGGCHTSHILITLHILLIRI